MQNQLTSKFFAIFLFCSLGLLFGLFWAYISAIVMALLIASAFYPFYVRIRTLFKGHQTSASLFMTLFILLVLIIPVGLCVATLSKEAFQFYNDSKSAVSLGQIQEALKSDSMWAQWVRDIGRLTGVEFTPEAFDTLTASLGKKVGLFLFNQISSLASNLFSLLIHLFLMLMTIFYLFRDGMQLKGYITQILPVPKEQAEKLGKKFQEMSRAIIVGNGVSALGQGLLGGCGFFIFGLSSPFLWGSVIAFLAFVPFMGVSFVSLPAAVILMLQGRTTAAIFFWVYNFAYSSIIEYVVKPRVIGSEVKMNSLLVFIGIIGGIKLFGILGIIYGPLIITIFLTLAEIYRLEYKGQEI